MKSIIERIDRKQFWKFHGGIHPPEQKTITSEKPIRTIELPKMLVLPLQQHIGQAGALLVKEGDSVLKGQQLTECSSPMAVPIHAPTSGTISAIKSARLAHPSGLSGPCIFLTPDGIDKWQERIPCEDFYDLSRENIINKIANAGIAGMGGAGFPTHIKVNTKPAINFLIINAAECEPYITADDLLIKEHSTSIVDGIRILDHLLLPEFILIGIEDNKPQAIKALQQATKHIEKIRVCVLPTKYPTGGEKQLIKALTGQEVQSGMLPINLGIVMQNVATCYAIADAIINDSPLIKRVVTVTGQALNKPQNIWSLIGTSTQYLLEQCGYNVTKKPHLIMGGPMMGFSLSSNEIPIIKTSNCILAPSDTEISSDNNEVDCIRCGQCAEVCPSQLLPQELQWSAKAKDHDQLKKLNLFDCIDCGACAYVCPSQIPLVQYYRVAKAEIRQQHLLDLKAEKAKTRFEARKTRLEQEKRAREEKHKKAAEARKAAMNKKTTEGGDSAKSAVAAALARVKAKKAQNNNTDGQEKEKITNSTVSPEKSQVAAAIARAKAKKLAKEKVQQNTQQVTDEPVQAPAASQETAISPADVKKAKVAAAVAKAKAKKAASKNKQEQEQQPKPSTEKTPAADKKAKIAAAVAKAKAKKLAAKKQADLDAKTDANTNIETNTKTNAETNAKVKLASKSSQQVESK